MKARILIVDDDPHMLEGAAMVLDKDYEVLALGDPREALDRVHGFAPEIAILDVRMPGLDGFQLMAALKETRPDLDVILMTGSVAESDRKLVRAIRGEAFYFLLKPFERTVLLTLVERCFKLRRLAESNRRQMRHIQAELAHARAFQRSLLPPAEAVVNGWALAARYQPVEELCGDLYDYAPWGDDGVAFFVADVSNHGAGAAMLTAMIKSAFHSCAPAGFPPQEITERVHAGIKGFQTDHFVTLLAGRLSRGSLEYVNAGHPAALLWPPLRELEPTGIVVHPELSQPGLSAATVPFPDDAQLLVYTDGVVEAQGGGGERFELERLKGALQGTGATLLDHVVGAVRDFGGGRPLGDDVTLLTVARA